MSVDPMDYFVGTSGNCFNSNERLPFNDEMQINGIYDQPLYRVLEQRYADDWIEKGELRISPLDSYREISVFSRRDRREGSVVSVQPNNNLFLRNAAPSLSLSLSRYPLKCVVDKLQHGHTDQCVVIEISNPTQWLKHLDLIVRRTCSSCSWPIWASMATHVAYSNIPNLDFGPQGAEVNAVFLKPRAVLSSDGTNAYWLESEVRAIWQSHELSSPNYVFVKSPNLAEGCRILSPHELMGDNEIPNIVVRTYDAEDHAQWTSSLGNPRGVTAWHRGNSGNCGG